METFLEYSKHKFSKKQAEKVAKKIGIEFDKEEFTLSCFHKGMNVEAEHGRVDLEKPGKKDLDTNVTNDDLIKTGKIALAHLQEDPKYYKKLATIEDH